MSNKRKIYNVVKWLFVIAAFFFLAYKLITFDNYTEFLEQWKEIPPKRFIWLAGVLLLLPLNLLLEGFKWKFMVSNVEKISFADAMKGVFAGITTGFFTPNRIGDLVGRVFFLRSDNRPQGVTLSLLNSLTQNLIIILCGIPACILFFLYIKNDVEINVPYFILICFVLLLVLGFIYFKLPAFSKKIKHTRIGQKIYKFTDFLSTYSFKELSYIILITFLRYLVFSTQFFLMLRFFDVDLSFVQAIITIPTNYLFVTITPAIAFSEMAVRASYAVMLFESFSSNTVNIALAGASIWFVNWVIPLVIGSVFIVKTKIQ